MTLGLLVASETTSDKHTDRQDSCFLSIDTLLYSLTDKHVDDSKTNKNNTEEMKMIMLTYLWRWRHIVNANRYIPERGM